MDDPPPSAGPSRPPLPPLQNPRFRHISRSAAKRESVQLLGSIKDLQLHFSRAATIEHKPGVGVGVRGLGAVGEEDENVPPTTLPLRDLRPRRPYKEVELPRVQPEVARAELREVLGGVRALWGIAAGKGGLRRSPTTATLSPAEDTRSTLIDTARAVRRTRELSLALISQPGRRVSGSSLTVSRTSQGRASISTSSRPHMPRVSSGPERKSSLGTSVGDLLGGDQLAELRKAALEVLAGLRGLEERLREGAGASAGAEEAQGGLRVPSSSSSESRPGSELSNLTSEPESMDEDEFNVNILAADVDLHRHLQTWEERIVAEGREYRVMRAGEGVRERDAVKRWVGEVEALFLDGEEREEEGWVGDVWQGRELERIHDFITSHLPFEIELLVPSTAQNGFSELFMDRLSDGYLLVLALNTALHRSPQPWGFISDSDVHDTLALPEDDSRSVPGEWTFRRVGNLTAWAAALRHRYQIPLVLPHTTHPAPSYLTAPPLPSTRPLARAPEGRPVILPLPLGPAQVAQSRRKVRDGTEGEGEGAWAFDPMVVARKQEGWEGMLRGVLEEWVRRAAGEMRAVKVKEGKMGVEEEKGKLDSGERGGRI